MVFKQQPILVGRIFHPGRSHGCCPGRTTGGSLPCGRYLLKKKGASAFYYSELSLHQVGSRPTVFILRWTTQVCATRGAGVVVETQRSAETLPGSEAWTESGVDGSPKRCCLASTACGHRCSQCSTVCDSSPQLRH